MNKNGYLSKIETDKNLSNEQKQEYIKRLENIVEGMPILLTKYHLSSFFGIRWYAFKYLLGNINNNYTNFKISKKKGGYRLIESPSYNLKQIQLKIMRQILAKIEISNYSFGFVRKKSIIDNANHHIDSNYLLGIDLKDFFPSIKKPRIYFIFRYLCGYCHEVSYTLTELVSKDNSLPQGAPTSPTISNIVSFKLDYRLSMMSSLMKLKYTRYADDITISAPEIFPKNIKYTIYKIIRDEGFFVNKFKTKYMNSDNYLEVTGIYIKHNELNVPRKYIKNIEQQLYYIEKFGLESHKSRTGIRNSFYIKHLQGCINYIKRIDSSKGYQLQVMFNETFIHYIDNISEVQH